jgi:hypothetical protein
LAAVNSVYETLKALRAASAPDDIKADFKGLCRPD